MKIIKQILLPLLITIVHIASIFAATPGSAMHQQPMMQPKKMVVEAPKKMPDVMMNQGDGFLMSLDDLSSEWMDETRTFNDDWYNNFMKECMRQPKDVIQEALKKVDAFVSTQLYPGDKRSYMIQNFYRPLGLTIAY